MNDLDIVRSRCVGEELRRILEVRRRRLRRLRLMALVAALTLPLAATLYWKPPTLLVWNASASAPIGLYRAMRGSGVRRGDMVVAWTPAPERRLAAARHYLPANVPLVKRVAAAGGDRVCASGQTVSINGSVAARRLARDSGGRPLPWWSGCRRLAPGEYLLLMDTARSFDGRYFGVTREAEIVGRARLLWAKPAERFR
jgi:conjugative transfer signal peptidase TraF